MRTSRRRFLLNLQTAATLLLLVSGLLLFTVETGILAGVRLALTLRTTREPPQLGETFEAVDARWGPAAYDSRTSQGDSDREYDLGHYGESGTRYHLHLKDGVVTQVATSSR